MADFVSFKLEGAEELRRQLQALPDKMRDKTFRAALRKGATVVRKDARARASDRAPAFAATAAAADPIALAIRAQERPPTPDEVSELMAARSRVKSIAMSSGGKTGKLSKFQRAISSKVRVNKQEAVAEIGLGKYLLRGRGAYTVERRNLYTRIGFFREYGSIRNPAKPFLRPALDAKKEEVVAVFQDHIQVALEKLAYEHRNSVVRR